MAVFDTVPKALDNDATEVTGKITPLVDVHFEPVGRWYEALVRRRLRNHSLSSDLIDRRSSSSEEECGAEDKIGDDDDSVMLLTLDPKEWKDQDHYSVLGLGDLRLQATEDQLKAAYKRKVLRHHPDKRRARGLPVKDGEEDYFTCITRAYEVLGNPLKRRSYDSVDPLFDNSVPSNTADNQQNFYKVFAPVFERNARWSKNRNVPLLGNDETSFDDVNDFYAFWYDFESWREFSYLDEEEKEKGENREERRWIDKQNRAARLKRKKEELQRVRQLVDNACACDPRIARFKNEEREKKAAERRAKQELLRQRTEQEEQRRREALEEEQQRLAREQEEARQQAASARKEMEAQKKMLRKEKKDFRTLMKEQDYFAVDQSQRVKNMQDVDKLAELLSVSSLQSLNSALSAGDREAAMQAYTEKVKEVDEQLEREKADQARLLQKQSSGGDGDRGKGGERWPEAETQLLIKAVNLFPAGTNARWETIANFIKIHYPDSNRSPKEVLAKAKDLQKNNVTLKEEANKKAFENFTKTKDTKVTEDVQASERYDTPAELQVYEMGSNPAPWTADEQKLLEQAMRTYPASVADRWDKIAESVPNRTKKDCMKRYKELVELVRTKKLAQAASSKKK